MYVKYESGCYAKVSEMQNIHSFFWHKSALQISNESYAYLVMSILIKKVDVS